MGLLTINKHHPLKATSAMVLLRRASRHKITPFFSKTITHTLRFTEIYSNVSTMWLHNYCKQITGFINHIIFMLVKNPFTSASGTSQYISYRWSIHGTRSQNGRLLFSRSRYLVNGVAFHLHFYERHLSRLRSIGSLTAEFIADVGSCFRIN